MSVYFSPKIEWARSWMVQPLCTMLLTDSGCKVKITGSGGIVPVERGLSGNTEKLSRFPPNIEWDVARGKEVQPECIYAGNS